MDIPAGTLDLMVLKTLQTLGPQHGYGIARRLEQVSGETIALNQGTIYPALVRLQQQAYITADWGTSENGRRAKFYALTRAGRRALASQVQQWGRTMDLMARVLES